MGWLCRKASTWVEHTTGEARSLVTDLAIAYVAGDPDADAADVMSAGEHRMQQQFQAGFADPLLFDAALHEGRLFRRFLYERSDLLPDDERLLATARLTVDRSVHENEFADETEMPARLSAELSRQARSRWLDDSIPALGGLTPRQAAADPTRREQLERLLSEFDRMDDNFRDAFAHVDGAVGAPITYDTAELRRELGIN